MLEVLHEGHMHIPEHHWFDLAIQLLIGLDCNK